MSAVRNNRVLRDPRPSTAAMSALPLSDIAGTVLQGTKLPMRVWFRAMHLFAQGKKGLSNN